VIEAAVFDLDGVLIDSEHVWDEVRQRLAEERGGRWHEQASRDMMGMSSREGRRRASPAAQAAFFVTITDAQA
jgi:beta-phosphoglucomutase-like phosphatase (HAD superfamily)